jgi:ABC-type phosphate transport system substrate-binding protein
VRNRSRKLAVLASIAAIATVVGLAAPAGAGPTVLTGNKNSLGQAGSDTTYWMMNLIAPQYNVNVGKNTDGDYVTEIPPVNNAPFPAGTFVPGDDVTGSTLWDSSSAPVTPPNGSSAGISALDADTTGAIDFARSSRGPNTGETSTKNFWAYGLGALDYVTFTGTNAPPAGLTQQNLINIYTCNASGTNVGKPIFSDWHQLNPNAPVGSTIVKYLPQTSSGTYSFFKSKILNGNTPDANCDASHLSTFLEEHDARGVTTASKPNAIYAFDWSRFRAQGAGFEANLKNGATLGKLGTSTNPDNRQLPSTTTVNTSPSRFLGTRYVFNVDEKANHPSSYTNQLLDVEKLIGVQTTANGGPGYICGGSASVEIALAGFVPLPLSGSGGVGLPQSHCKLNPPAL